MGVRIELFEREPCAYCADMDSDSKPFCSECNGSDRGKYIDKIAEAARWVLEGGECGKCRGYGIIIGHGYSDCPACLGARRFGPEDVRVWRYAGGAIIEANGIEHEFGKLREGETWFSKAKAEFDRNDPSDDYPVDITKYKFLAPEWDSRQAIVSREGF